MKLFRRASHETPPQREAFDMIRDVLPPTVRNQLSVDGSVDYRGVSELMVPERAQQRFGCYLALKATNGMTDVQQQLLETFCAKGGDFTQMEPTDIQPALEAMKYQDIHVRAEKLAEVSRKGFGNWVDFFMERYDTLVPKDAPVYLLAYSTVICLDKILEQHPSVNVLLPKQFSTDSASVGYVVDRYAGVQTISRDFTRPIDGILIDDIRNTGSAETEALDFWGQDPPGVYLAMASMQSEPAVP